MKTCFLSESSPIILWKIQPITIEHDCPEFRENNQTHSFFQQSRRTNIVEQLSCNNCVFSIKKKNPTHLNDWSKLNPYRLLNRHPKPSLRDSNQNSEPTREYWGFWGHVRKQSIKITSWFGVSRGEGFEHRVPLFVAGGFMRLLQRKALTAVLQHPVWLIDCKSLHRVPRSLVGSRSLNKIKALPMFCL